MIGAIILGIVAGFLGRLLMPGRDPMGFFATVLLGLAGAVVGFLIFTELLGIGDNDTFDLGDDRIGDRLEVLDLVARRAVGTAGVDVDHRRPLVDRPSRLGRVLGRRVGNRRALLAVGERARDRAGDDDRVVEAHAESLQGGK